MPRHQLLNAAPHLFHEFQTTQQSLREARSAFSDRNNPLTILKPLKPNALDDYDAAVKKNSMRLREGKPFVRVLQF